LSKVIFKPSGVCAAEISFELTDGIVTQIEFTKGCNGNAKGISRLAEGMPAEELVARLSGITCSYKKTSCPDQLAKAIARELAGGYRVTGKVLCRSFVSNCRGGVLCPPADGAFL
jgi:uncharacterized protein (TIGR03905 family)